MSFLCSRGRPRSSADRRHAPENSMYDFRLPLAFVTMAVVAIRGEMVGGELSAVEKSLQFEAAFQGEFTENSCTIN